MLSFSATSVTNLSSSVASVDDRGWNYYPFSLFVWVGWFEEAIGSSIWIGSIFE